MTIDELRAHLRQLIDRYIVDDTVRASLHERASSPDVPVKSILGDLTPLLSTRASREDRELIKDIAFYFC